MSPFPLGAGSIFQGGGGVVEIPGGEVKKRQSPDFRSPEIGISDIDCFVSCGLTWHITDEITRRTRRKIVNKKRQESTLDQLFTSDSDIIKQITLGPPVRGSHHLTTIMEVKLYDNVEFLVSEKFNWAKCNVPRLISTGWQIDWSYSDHDMKRHSTVTSCAANSKVKYYMLFIKVSGPIGHFQVPPGLCFKTRVGAQPLIWKSFFILIQIKLIFTRKVVHLALF